MTMWKEIVLSGCIMLALDSMYLYAMRETLALQIASVQRVSIQFRYLGALLCYALLIAGLYYFILRTRRPITDAFLLGILIYGVYETTNYATFKKWTPFMLVTDTLWGGVLLALTTFITYKILRK